MTQTTPQKHKWTSQKVGGHPADASSTEWVCYCSECGAEQTDDNEHDDCPAEDIDKFIGEVIDAI